MSIVEFNGGPITMRYLENKSRHDLARMYMDHLNVFEGMKARAEKAEAALRRIESHIDRPEAFNSRIQEHIDVGLGRSVQREEQNDA